MKTVLMASIAVLALVMAPSHAFAGGGNNGGGTKQNGTVTVHNDTDEGGSGTRIVAILAPRNSDLSNLQAELESGSATEASIRSAASQDGAQVRFISAGNSQTFTNVRAGSQQLTVADLEGELALSQRNINVSKGRTTNISVTSDGSSLSF